MLETLSQCLFSILLNIEIDTHMKDLKQFIAEGLSARSVNEKLSSDNVRELFKSFKYSNLTGVKSMKSLYKWDQMRDDDLQTMDSDEAYKLARKRDNDTLIIWCRLAGGGGLQYKVNAVSIGTSMLSSAREQGRVTELFKSVKKAAEYSHKAILIKDSSRFSTSELRAARRNAKENALALKELWEISYENDRRYQQLLKELREKKNTQDIQAYVDQATEIYTRVVPELSEELKDLPIGVIGSGTFKAIITKMHTATELYANVMGSCRGQLSDPSANGLALLKERLSKLQDFEKTIMDLADDLYAEAESN